MVLGVKNYAQNQDAEALLQKANDEYQNKDYVLAAELYEQLLSQGYVASELNFNLGNAYYKSENYTLAILRYIIISRIYNSLRQFVCYDVSYFCEFFWNDLRNF